MDFVQEMLERSNDEIARIARITMQTLAFHRDTQHPARIDLTELITDVVAMYQRQSSVKRVSLAVDSKPTPPVLGYSGQLKQVFGNLVRNASEAAPADSTVVVRIRCILSSGLPGARITIHDRGKGIPRAVQKKMFDPFFTTKELKGSGLGLWVSQSLIAKHKGSIRFRTSERYGTTFAVFLPTAQDSESSAVEVQRELMEA
jgi:signal transduction histidine kinase